MDFTTILHVAKKNSTVKDSGVNYYSTKFSPPKKISKEKKLSDNIKKFLEKKEQEEREKARAEREKRDKLISSRDERSKNKIKKMLKVIKSANKSVLEEAVDNEHTAVTMQGPDQPDEDDYGYVSNEAAAFYQKYVDKVKDVKEDKFFSPSRPQSRNDLRGTKDRVRAAIVKDQEDKTNFTRVRVSSSSSTASYGSASKLDSNRHNLYDPQVEKELEDKRKKEEDKKKMIFKKPAPPPMDFQSLLKLAEKKQYEPIEVIVEDKSKKKPERLLSSKEKRELEERRKYFEEKEKRKKEAENKMNGRIPKLSGAAGSGSGSSKPSPAGMKTINQSMGKIPTKSITSSLSSSLPKEPSRNPHISTGKPNQISHSNAHKPTITNNNIKNGPSSSSKLKTNMNSSIQQKGNQAVTSNIKSPINNLANGKKAPTAEKSGTINGKTLGKTPYSGPTRQFPPNDLKSRQLPTTNNQKTRRFPPGDVQRSRQFPPSDVRRNVPIEKSRNKRRIIDDDDDDEDEYDSELDDFIDDGDAEDDYSSHIKEIFGYDKSKYRDYDEDDSAMESTFAQQMREEFVSKKIGLMEDLEDMRQEAEEKKKKLQMKKRQKFN